LADASNLRNRVYQLESEREIMRTALDDIRRMDPEGHIGWYAKSTLDKLDGRE
jgi:predicted KAP-like P-loop ATPase